MKSLPTNRLDLDDESDEELSDEQIRQLLDQAAARMRLKTSLPPKAKTEPSLKLPKLQHGHIADTLEITNGNITHLDQSKLVDKKQQVLAEGFKRIDDPFAVRKLKKQEEKKASAGPQWFNMPKTDLTPDLKRDLQLLKMRNVLDPKRHYKKDNSKNDVPAYSHVGTIIEGPTEFYSSRIANKDRKQTILAEVIAQEQEGSRFKRKYNDIFATKSSGKKIFYKALKAKRSKGKISKP